MRPTKPCARCKVVKASHEYYARRYSADKLTTYCQACCRVLQAEYRARRRAETHDERVAEFQRALQTAGHEVSKELAAAALAIRPA